MEVKMGKLLLLPGVSRVRRSTLKVRSIRTGPQGHMLRNHGPRPVPDQRYHPRIASILLGRRLRHAWLDHIELRVYRREVSRVAQGVVTLDEAEHRVIIESALAVAERTGLVEHFTNRKS